MKEIFELQHSWASRSKHRKLSPHTAINDAVKPQDNSQEGVGLFFFFGEEIIFGLDPRAMLKKKKKDWMSAE